MVIFIWLFLLWHSGTFYPIRYMKTPKKQSAKVKTEDGTNEFPGKPKKI